MSIDKSKTITCIFVDGPVKGEVRTYQDNASMIIKIPCAGGVAGEDIEFCNKSEIQMWMIEYIFDVASSRYPNIRYYILKEEVNE